ncbi:MAG: FMN-binding protein [Lachnospiraceae bacterium]|nr:FMN-binding protein [Lachnospiraceae bacterium]
MKKQDNKKRIISIAVLGAATVAAFGLSIGLKAYLNKSKYEVSGAKNELVIAKAYADRGVKEAYQLSDGSYLVTVASQGFGGEVVLDVYVEADKKTVRGVDLVSQNETEGYGAKIASDAAILTQFEGVVLPVYTDKVIGAGLENANKADEADGADNAELTDGTYTAEAVNGDYRDVVSMTVESGIITDVVIESYDEDGNAKSKLAAEGKYVMSETGLTWDKQAEAIAAYVLENQGVSKLPVGENGKTDAIAGVSIAVSGTVELIEQCIAQAAGEASESEGEHAVTEGTEVDGISGATVTTKAMLTDLNKAYTFLNQPE